MSGKDPAETRRDAIDTPPADSTPLVVTPSWSYPATSKGPKGVSSLQAILLMVCGAVVAVSAVATTLNRFGLSTTGGVMFYLGLATVLAGAALLVRNFFRMLFPRHPPDERG